MYDTTAYYRRTVVIMRMYVIMLLLCECFLPGADRVQGHLTDHHINFPKSTLIRRELIVSIVL